MAMPLRLAAPDKPDNHKHHHCQLIDVGTFGGPSSYFNSLSATHVFGFRTVFYNMAQVRNAQGVFVGFANTSSPDPYAGLCYVPDGFVASRLPVEKRHQVLPSLFCCERVKLTKHFGDLGI
jgi:hypothetical protein